MPENRYSGDVFGKKIADSTKNDGDLAGHYPYSPERWRFFDGTLDESNRIFLQYANDSRYQHQLYSKAQAGSRDVHTIVPNQSDTLYFKTAERFRYVVNYQSDPTWAFSISRALQDGDELIIGPTDFTDGYACRFNSDLGANKCEFFQYRNGTENSNKVVNLATPITDFTRLEWSYAWYEMMGVQLTQSYNFDNWQLATIGYDGNRNGPSIANLPISAKITRGANSDPLEVYLGSASWNTKGNVTPITRQKVFAEFGLSKSATTEWECLGAIRKDPLRNFIQVEFDEVELSEFTGNDDAFVIAMIMSPERVKDSGGNPLDDTDFVYPDELNEVNSVIQWTPNAVQFPDVDGNIVSSAVNPGGYQVGYASLYSVQGSQQGRRGAQRTIKRKVYNGDYVVILGRTRGETSGDFTLEFITEQDY